METKFFRKVSSDSAKRLRKHVNRWKGCERCSLCETRENVVTFRGSIPADLLLIGEAPGTAEDDLALPFVGPSGHLLEKILAEAISKLEQEFSYAITNTVGCLPIDEDGSTRAPSEEEINACNPRVVEFLSLARAKGIVFVGKVSLGAIGEQIAVPSVAITHPAAILRADESNKGTMYRKAIHAITKFAKDIL